MLIASNRTRKTGITTSLLHTLNKQLTMCFSVGKFLTLHSIMTHQIVHLANTSKRHQRKAIGWVILFGMLKYHCLFHKIYHFDNIVILLHDIDNIFRDTQLPSYKTLPPPSRAEFVVVVKVCFGVLFNSSSVHLSSYAFHLHQYISTYQLNECKYNRESISYSYMYIIYIYFFCIVHNRRRTSISNNNICANLHNIGGGGFHHLVFKTAQTNDFRRKIKKSIESLNLRPFRDKVQAKRQLMVEI